MRSRLIAKSPRMRSSVNRVIAKRGRPNGAAMSKPVMRNPPRAGSTRVSRMASYLLAEEATRADHQHQQHHEVHERERKVRQIVVAEHLDERDKQCADERAQKATHAADDHDDEGVDYRRRRHAI